MIRLKNLINEAGDYTAKNKESGKLVHFKSKDAYAAAIKAGSHEDPNAKTPNGGSAKSGVNIYNTPSTPSAPTNDYQGAVRYYDKNGKPKIKTFTDKAKAEKFAADNDSHVVTSKTNTPTTPSTPTVSDKPKSTKIKLGKDEDGNMTDDSASSVEAELNKVLGGDGVAEVNYDTGNIEYTIPNKDGDWDAALYIGSDEDGTGKGFAVSIEGNVGGDIGDTYKTFKKQSDAISYAVELAQKFKKELGASSKEKAKSKSKAFDANVDEKDFQNALGADGFDSYSGNTMDGVSAFGDDAGNSVYISAGSVYSDEKPYAVSGYNEDDDSDTNYKSFDSKDDAIAYAKQLGQKLI